MDPNSEDFLEQVSDVLGVNPEDLEEFLDSSSPEAVDMEEEDNSEDLEEDL